MSTLQPLLERVIERWRAENIAIPHGVDQAKIEEFESRYGITLPADMENSPTPIAMVYPETPTLPPNFDLRFESFTQFLT